MSGGFCCPSTCGFAKVAAVTASKKAKEQIKKCNGAKSDEVRERYNFFCQVFQDSSSSFNIDINTFNKRFLALESVVKKWNPRKKLEKKRYFEGFSIDRWLSLSNARKQQHSFTNCKGCFQNFADIRALFPVKNPRLKVKGKENPFRLITDLHVHVTPGSDNTIKPKQEIVTNAARKLFQEINPIFNKWAGCSLGQALSKVPEANVEVKKSKTERKKIHRNLMRTARNTVESQWKKTSMQRCFGNRQSYASRQRERLASCYESKKQAKERHISQRKSEKKKKHTGPANTQCIDIKALTVKVKAQQEGTIINWSDLARKYNIVNKRGSPAKNGGQVIHDILLSQEVNVNKYKKPTNERIRRKKLKGSGGEISVPTPESNGSIKRTLKAKIEEGEIKIGELIVPKRFKKLILDKDNKEIRVTEFTVEGRKIPLEDIRKDTLEKSRCFMRYQSDEFYNEMREEDVIQRLKYLLGEFNPVEELSILELKEKLKCLERTRHLMIWHDHSTIANHGHLLFLVSILYDPAIHLTSEEYKEKTGQEVNIQEEVERPQLYIIARCADTDAEQLAYIETRCECIQRMTTPIEIIPGIFIDDIMRFCKGDGPAVEFETGQQRGGHYFCSGCAIHSCMTYQLDHAFRMSVLSLQQRQKLITDGPITLKNSLLKKANPCSGLSKEDLQKELSSRRIQCPKDDKDSLQKEVTHHLHGQKRVPALLYLSPTATLEELNIIGYEVLPCEPMHDLAGHISNVLQELPHHLTETEGELLKETVKLSTEGKEKKRACDQRYSIIAVSSRMRGHVTRKVQQLIDTLVDMQQILYQGEDERCPRMVLRYYNQSFLHAILCFEVLGFKPKTMTCRKLYGKYFHNLITHAPLQLRLISGQAVNAEDEERLFSSINSITKATSSKRPAHLIGNAIVRLQAEEQLRLFNEGTRSQEMPNKIKRLALSLPTFLDTLFPSHILHNYHKEWQAHLERIGDFLLAGPAESGGWWEFDGSNVIFLDSSNQPKTRQDGPDLSHFRYSTMEREEGILGAYWEHIIEESISVPAHYLSFPCPDNPAATRKTKTGFLQKEDCAMQNDNVVDNDIDNDVDNDFGNDLDSGMDNDVDNGMDNNVDGIDAESCYNIETEPTVEQLLEINAVNLDDNNDVNNRVTISQDQTEIIQGNSTNVNSLNQIPPLSDIKPSCSPTYDLSTPKENTKDTFEKTEHSDNSRKKHEENYEFQTRLATAVSNVLGNTSEVIKLDRLKKKSNNSSYDNEQYINCLASIQAKVLAEESKLERKFKEWEQQYFVNHNLTSPSIEDINRDRYSSGVYKKLKHGKALLKHWKINF